MQTALIPDTLSPLSFQVNQEGKTGVLSNTKDETDDLAEHEESQTLISG